LRLRSVAVPACLLSSLTFGLAACGGGGGGSTSGSSTGATTLTIYSSLPLDPDDAPQTQSTINGEKLALEQNGGKVGKYTIKYVSLDDSTASQGQWDPGQTSSNARKASQDKSAIAYLGEFNSGASEISIPILNEAGLLQISPANTYVGLTRAQGALPGEPDKWYPTGKRTYGRVVPADHIQAAAQTTYQKDAGCTKTYIFNDKQAYGKGIADNVQKSDVAAGIQVPGNDGIDIKSANFRTLAQKVKSSGADCFFFGGITPDKANQVWSDVYAANPNIKLFGPDGVAETSFTSKLPTGAQAHTYITVATIDPKDYPPEGQKFFTDYKAKYGKLPEPYGIYGYEAMSLLLDSMKRAGSQCNNKDAVIKQVFATKNKPSVLGTYSIDKDGDTTVNQFGRYLVKGGKLVFNKTVLVKKDSYGRPLG